MEFKSIINTLYRRRLLILCVFLAFFLPMFLGIFMIGPWFESSAKVWIYRSKATTSFLSAMSLTPTSLDSSVGDSERESYISLAKVRPVVDAVVEELKLTKVRTRYRILEAIPLMKSTLQFLGIKYGPTSRIMTTKELTDTSIWLYLFPYPHIDVSQDGDSDLIEIKVTSPDIAQAKDIANATARQFIKNEFSRVQGDYRQVKEYIEANIARSEKEFQKAQQELEAFRLKEGTLNLDTETTNLLTRILEVRRSKEETEINIYKAKAAWRSLQEQIKSTPEFQRSPDLELRVSDAITSLKTKLTDLLVEQAEAKNKYGPSHPQFIELESRIAQAKDNLQKEISGFIALDAIYTTLRQNMIGYLSDVASGQAMIAAWSTVLTRYEKEMRVLPNKIARYAQLSLNATSASTVHQIFLDYKKKTSLAEFLDVQNLRLVESASEMNPEDSKPSWKLNTAVGILLGVFFGLCAAFCMEYLDDTVKTSIDLRSRGRGTYLGSMARPVRRRGPFARLTGWAGKLKPAMIPPEQAAGIISQGLRLQAGGGGPRSIVVTSALRDDGAAYLSGVLARGLARGLSQGSAQDGPRVVLVDAGVGEGDGDEGGLHEDLGLKAEPGLAEFLAGKAGAREVCQTTKIAGLSLVARGKIKDDDAYEHTHGYGHVHSHAGGHAHDQALDAGSMQRLLEGLGDQAGLVVVAAAPPLLARASAMNLLGWAEAVIFCAEAARTSGRDLDEALELAMGAPAALKGLVLYQTEGTFWYRL
jgi:uncharacterized protein involved in exopolysaccharide biosynthesis